MTSVASWMSSCRILSTLILVLSISIQAYAQFPQPQSISFQGTLADSDGDALTDTLSIDFALYDSTDAPVWTETHPAVSVIGGVFFVRLGSITPFGITWGEPYELGISVDGDPEMTPRTQLDSSPYALSNSCQQYALTACSDGCSNTMSDTLNCGSCGNTCAVDGVCTSGTCGCGAFSLDCSGVCRVVITDINNCGGCGIVCPVDASCVFGSCECPGGAPDICADTCTNVLVDDQHCGSCGNNCPSGSGCCTGSCTDFNDVNNCGGCGNVCDETESCNLGECQPL